jgi:hypothetical protein
VILTLTSKCGVAVAAMDPVEQILAVVLGIQRVF